MDKKYQVFVSSTFKDLQKERQAVIQHLLEIDCIPIGMEYFPASDDTSWEVISQLIDTSDYYVVIVAGKYGSQTEEGISFTQKEYEYALERGIPVLAFLHGDPGTISAQNTEMDQAARQKLEEFRKLCERKLCRKWTTPDDLGAAVITSLTRLKQTHPRSGWARADKLADEEANREIVQLRRKVESLEKQIRRRNEDPPPGTEELAQGADVFRIGVGTVATIVDVEAKVYAEDEDIEETCELSWNEILEVIGPRLMGACDVGDIGDALSGFIWRHQTRFFGDGVSVADSGLIAIDQDTLYTILLQFRALGVVEDIPTGTSRSRPLFRLTQFGDAEFTRLRAIKRQEPAGKRAKTAKKAKKATR